MNSNQISRREYLKLMGVSAVMAASNLSLTSQPTPPGTDAQADRARRMKWWHEAKFGMFIHWGLDSVVGRHEWVMENEAIPIAEYEQLAKRFNPKPNAARDWAKLARRAGMKYMVMTTKHHEGFCLFDTKTTNYCAPKQAAGRDVVKEYVEAARSEGLRVGFYYSLIDWHHPDGARCAEDEAARKRFVEYVHIHVRELMSNYGKIDILWYDVAWPLEAPGWRSEEMNQMVFQLQPDIIVNNRNKLPGNFSTPEQRIQAEEGERAWESRMTMNDSWGYHHADDNWKTPKQIIRNLIACSRDGGNYLLNIGPKPDGSIPMESVRILSAVGRKGNTLYVHIHFWPGGTVTVAGLMTQVKSARLLATGQKVEFQQDRFRVRFVGLPEKAPDDPITTIAVECESEPRQDNIFVRREKGRGQV